jgi:type VI secretion system protein ImpL
MRLGVTTLGLSVIGAFLWPHIRSGRAAQNDSAEGKGSPANSAAADNSGDIGPLIYDLQASAGRKLADTPALLILNTSSATGSTGLIENSGLNAEPLASITGGKAWIAQNTIFLGLAAPLFSDPKAMGALARSLGSRQFQYVFAKTAQPSRAIVLTLPTKNFLDREKATEAKARAQELRSRLREVSRALGLRLPFSVVFTGLEDVSHFKEYATYLASELIADPFGVSLREELGPTGVWAEQQAKRIARGLRQLFEFLSARRLDILNEEEAHDRRRGAYLFPREFRRLSRLGSIGDFLLEVSRPHQLGSSPYLRGFFFVGSYESQRPRTVPQSTGDFSSSDLSANLELSRVLSRGRFERSFVSRPAPKQMEWVFLKRLFGETILPNLESLRATFVSQGASVGRLILLGAMSALILLWAGGLTISFRQNRILETHAAELTNQLSGATVTPQQRIETPRLIQLDALRTLLAGLGRYRVSGHPWYIGMGLYTGDKLYPIVRNGYFNHFERLLLAPAQAVLRSKLSSLGPSSTGATDFETIYDSLKAYLITRSHPDNSIREFLSPVLVRSWQIQQGDDVERSKLAKAQFDFYSDEWRANPPYPRHVDDDAIASGRKFLQDNFGGIDQIYSLMKTDASKANPAIVFSGADVIVNTPKVSGAFSKAGWLSMQRLMHDSGHWSAPEVESGRIASELPLRYRAEYIKQWADFLGNSRVVCCRTHTAADTAKRLSLLAEATESPLLRLFCIASQNTDVDAPEIKSVFQPIRSVVPPSCDKQYTSDANAGYLSAPFGLQQRLSDPSLGSQSADARSAVAPPLASARTAAHDLAAKFQVDNEWLIHQNSE